MFSFWTLFIVIGYYYSLGECLIPTLNVQKLDRKLIERKRQDTLDLCRMFTEENELVDRLKTGVASNNFIKKHNMRTKRDLKLENASLDFDEIERIDNIVNKLYDDMAGKGEKVTYRQREFYTTTVKANINLQNQSARRFEFAPAFLGAPSGSFDTKQPMKEPTSHKVTWAKRWKHGIVPYFIDSNTYDSHLSEIIRKAFDYFEKATCIRLQRLRERPTDKESLHNVEWLYISNPSGIRQCVHSNERKENRGVQMVVFGYDCLSLGEIVHEIMHILGFSHEHTRPDRDQYITVLWDNIKPGYKKYFELRSEDILMNIPYDYASVLHYPPRAFSKNGQVTLMTEAGIKIGQREGLSDVDITKVTTVYGPECMDRNKEYLLKTCPSVVRSKKESNNVTYEEIKNYFSNRLWPYGIINYSVKDPMEFSIEERENINAVIRHIEKETCIEFRDMSLYDIDGDEKRQNEENIAEEEERGTDKQPHEAEDNDQKLKEPANIITFNEKTKLTLSNDYDDEYDDGKIQTSTIPEKDLNDLRKGISIKKIDFPKGSENSLTHVEDLKTSHDSGSILKVTPSQNVRVRRNAGTTVSAGRRHAENTLTLVRSLEPGCQCPSPGKPNGNQELKINADCFNSVNDLLHLFVHILGLDHQHNMHDRDSYLHILWDNLTPKIRDEMQQKLPPAAAVGFPYDYQSVMHYPWLQIKNGVTNIMYPIWNDGWAMGHWQGLSSTDVNKLNLIYADQCRLRREETY